MHPRTEELLRHLDANRAELCAAVDAVPSEIREKRPVADRWSVALVLEHLARVESGLTKVLTGRLAEARAAGQLAPETDTSPVASAYHDVMLDRTRLIVAGDRVVPRGEMDSATALGALSDSRSKLRELIVAHDGLSIAAVNFPHPVFGPIDGYQWFLFIGSHEARHAAQIREIGAQLAE
ncbi:MAG TPA: DinB family protein [Gemmatimonadaceae bacterium]|nr:DinB family protein [Gemmatimonadaceae bacterium]